MFHLLLPFCYGVECMTLIMCSIIFWVDRQRGPVNTRLYKLCCVLTGYIALMVLVDAMVGIGIIQDSDFLRKLTDLNNLLAVPLCAIILKDLTNSLRFTTRHILGHFHPFVVLLLLFIVCYPISTGAAKIVYWCYMAYVVLYTLSQLRAVILSYKRYENQLEDVYADTEGRSLKWLRGMLVPLLFLLVRYLVIFVGIDDVRFMPFDAIVASCIWLYFCYFIHKMHYSPALRNTKGNTATPFELIEDLQHIGSKEAEAASAGQPQSHHDSSIEKSEADIIITRLRQKLDATDLMQAEELTREDLARAIGTNHIKLSKALRQVTGMTLSAYVTDYRMTVAARLLLTTDDSVEQIIYQCGYNTRPPFYRAFQSKYGCTPLEMRERKEADAKASQD